MEVNQIYCGDNLKIMPNIPDKSINLIIADPPYNINKADWDKIPNYIEWLGSRLLEMQRVLKDNGSFYLFHNDFLQMVDIQNWINKNSKFVFKQFMVWNKKFKGVGNEGYLQGFNEVEGLRNYQKMAEYILFYTFQDETGLSTVFNNPNCFMKLKEYFYNEKKKGNFTNKNINEILGTATNGSGMAGHYFKKDLTQWTLPTKEMYQKLQTTGYFQRPYKNLYNEYKDLLKEYLGLRREYEGLRYTYNNQKSHHSVWNYDIANRVDHITPKPIELIKNILRHSSNEGDTVLIPFVGSGNDCIACKELKRDYIGIEDKLEYVEIARRRIKAMPELLFKRRGIMGRRVYVHDFLDVNREYKQVESERNLNEIEWQVMENEHNIAMLNNRMNEAKLRGLPFGEKEGNEKYTDRPKPLMRDPIKKR